MTDVFETKYHRMVEKLKAHAKSAADIGSIEEAALFAEKAQRLMAQHNIDESELSSEDSPAICIVDIAVMPEAMGAQSSRRRSGWREELLRTVTNAFGCRFLVRTGSSRLTVVGNAEDAEYAVDVFTALCLAVERLRPIAYRKAAADRHKTTANFAVSYRAGFHAAIYERMKRIEKQLETDMPGSALVLVNAKRDAVTKSVNDRFPSSRRLTHRCADNFHAFMDGHRDGQKANTTPSKLKRLE